MYCVERQTYADTAHDQGSFATAAIWPEQFLFHIPEALTNEEAAPLMCAGASVFSPLMHGNIKPTQRVGILGVGGLGHLAIQFASKMGFEVVVLSRSAHKEEEARRLGAMEFHVFADDGKRPSTLKEPLEHLLVTSSRQPDWMVVCDLMAIGGTIHVVTVTMGEMRLPYMIVLQNALRIHGSVPAPRQMHKEMLRFAARHNIRPIITTFPMNMDGIRTAFKVLEEGKMRYRGVLVRE